MKRIICILLCLIMLFTVCGCSSKSDNNSSEMSTTQNTEIKEDVSNSETDEGDADSSTQTETTSGGETSENDKTSNPTESTKNPETQTSSCLHKKTILKNQVTATCMEVGYTGDKYCADCDKLISLGKELPSTDHIFYIKNKKDATMYENGYSGDTYCKTCSYFRIGSSTPKLEGGEDLSDGKIKYTTSNGYEYIVDKDVNIMDYTMALRTKKIDSPYREFEMEILRLCNEERAKVGLAPLEWYDDAYYFTYIRAEESSITFSHTRPNWSNWDTVYTDAGVILHGVWGENLFYAEGWPAYEIAEEAVKNWMNSPGHKANILNPEYTRLTVAIYEKYIGEVYCLSVTQNFFG